MLTRHAEYFFTCRICSNLKEVSVKQQHLYSKYNFPNYIFTVHILEANGFSNAYMFYHWNNFI